MNKFIYIILSFYIINANAQQNLVLNPSFEDNFLPIPCGAMLMNSTFPITNWTSGSVGSSDIFSTTVSQDCLNYGIVTNLSPRTGNNFVHIHSTINTSLDSVSIPTYREYIRGQLSNDLQIGIPYRVEFYIRKMNSFFSNTGSNNIGVKFINNELPIYQNTNVIPEIPEVNYFGAPLMNGEEWILMSFIFVPTETDLNAFIIGNFFEDNETIFEFMDDSFLKRISYAIDDVAVFALVTDFNIPTEICVGEEIILPNVSLNGVEGTWSPEPNNQETTTYIFQPNIEHYPTTEITIVVNPIQIPVFNPIPPFCEPDLNFILPTVSTNGISGNWSPEFDPYNSQTYTFTPDAGECSEGFSMFVEVHPQLKFDVQSFCKSGLIYAEVIASNFSLSDISSYQWIINQSLVPESGNQIILSKYSHLLGEVNSIEVNIMDVNGCLHSKAIQIDENFLCKIQKGISPNGDGLNDYLDLVSFGGVDLKIFNRYGTVVYEKVNYINEWKGQSQSKEQLSSGTYFYFFKTNVGEEFSGYIQLMY